MIRNKTMELYIHIPFCMKKCAYCDFLSGPQDRKTIDAYVDSLIQEIHAHDTGKITSIFMGGGTPSVLSKEQMERIFDAVRECFVISEDAEITIEANPGTVTREKLSAYRDCGINRISFGLQSVKNEELRLLGRIHTYEAFTESYRLARECGFSNINVDLISAIPKQTVASWTDTLQTVIQLEPEHISAYSLIVEEGTPFAALYGEGCPKEQDLPDEDAEREMYYLTEKLLKEAGYHRYEISNYAKEGKECRHNIGYWERTDYLGVGLGAASLLDNVRYTNTTDLTEYLQYADQPDRLRQQEEVLSVTEQMEEFLFLGLRKMEGISLEEFEKLYGKSLEDCYGKQIERLTQEGLLEVQGDRIKLTSRGIDVSNYVFAEFIEDR